MTRVHPCLRQLAYSTGTGPQRSESKAVSKSREEPVQIETGRTSSPGDRQEETKQREELGHVSDAHCTDNT